jgi:hypothetical protein
MAPRDKPEDDSLWLWAEFYLAGKGAGSRVTQQRGFARGGELCQRARRSTPS